MKIAIFETEHYEGAFPVIKLFDTPGNELTIYTSADLRGRFQDLFGNEAGRYKWVVLPKGKFKFFHQLYKNLKNHKPDIFYINTVSSNHILYAIVLKLLSIRRIVLTVHDINCLFDSRSSWNFRKAIIHKGKKWLTRLVNEFNVVSDTMIPHLRTKLLHQNIYSIPGAVFENVQQKQAISDHIRLVVPGSLDKRRRDYEQVFRLAELANTSALKLDIILLGAHYDDYGVEVAKRAGNFKSQCVQIAVYDGNIVAQNEFDKQMDAAHFVFIPSVVNTKICGDIPEVYGISKSSGNIFDVIKHAKPFIAPAALKIASDLETSCFKYSKIEELITFLTHIVANPKTYFDWQVKALTNSGNYTIQKIRAANPKLFN